MNPRLADYFDAVEARLIESPAIHSYAVVRREVSWADGKLRVKAILDYDDTLELFLFMIDTDAQVWQSKYSFHWQDAQGCLMKRWDNAPHHPGLDNAPHHVHVNQGQVESMPLVPDVFFVIDQIEAAIN